MHTLSLTTLHYLYGNSQRAKVTNGTLEPFPQAQHQQRQEREHCMLERRCWNRGMDGEYAVSVVN